MRSDFQNYSDEFTLVTEFYENEIDKDSLKVQLLGTYFEKQGGESVSLLWYMAISANLNLRCDCE